MRALKKLAKRYLPAPLVKRLRHLSLKRPKLLEDVYKTGGKHRVLLCYITEPFLHRESAEHTNHRECRAIAEVFHERGYTVDVIPYDSAISLRYARYECVFGFGDPFCAVFRQNEASPLCIHYATGAHVARQNTATLARARAVRQRRGAWLLDSCRVVPKAWWEQSTLADAIVALGGTWAAQSFAEFYPGPVHTLSSLFDAALPLERLTGKDFAEARNHYLWFGSTGAVHKGLDLLLEAFAATPERFLHIAGPLEQEEAFRRTYARELARPNIVMHGYVDVRSAAFEALMRKCAFVLLPSCSEGSSTSLLNTMANGLVPVMTPVCGFAEKTYGIVIEKPSLGAVNQALSQCGRLTPEGVSARSAACLRDIRNHHDAAAFKARLHHILGQLLPGAGRVDSECDAVGG